MQNTGKNILLTRDNLTVSYSDEGPAHTAVIIFIHGFPFNKYMWRSQVDEFRNVYRVITYDVRGHGSSDAGDEDFTIELFVRDLISLLNTLNVQRPVLCGLSMGGYIALNAVVNYPEHFSALILSDTQCAADTPEGREKRMKTIQNIKDQGVEQYADESIKKLFTADSVKNIPAEVNAVRQMIVKTAEQTLYKTLLALSERKETCSRLAEIKLPTLILVGEEDQITPPAFAQIMHEKIPHSSLAIIAQTGHLPNIEDPVAFNQHLTMFLAGLT